MFRKFLAKQTMRIPAWKQLQDRQLGKRCALLCFWIIVLLPPLAAQTEPDSTLHRTDSILHQIDSIVHRGRLLDSLGRAYDSTAQIDPSVHVDTVPASMPVSPNALKDVVDYQAKDSIELNVMLRRAYLYREGSVKYQDMTLKADAVQVDFKTTRLTATSAPDSNGRIGGKPFFAQGESEYLADTIVFNYNNKKGIISGIITQEGEGYLHGSRIKKMNDSVMFLSSGLYTTCNYSHPHFAINFSKSKIITGDKLLTGPAYLSLADVPTPIAIPFAFFSISHERSSGIVIPSYGWMNSRGYYLKDGGYYLALNDQVDLLLLGDIYTNLSWAAEARSNYYRRYRYKGNFDVRYGITKEGLEGDSNTYNKYSDFKIAWQHDQDPKANPYRRFSANVNLQSRNYNRNTSNRNDYFTSTTTSSISFTSQLGKSFNLAVSARESYNVQTGLINLQLPSVSVNSVSFYPFRRKNVVGSYKWYENISMSYTFSGENNISTGDSILFTAATLNKMQYGVQHAIPISSTIKVLKYFNWTNSISYNERWHWSTIEKNYDSATNNVTIDTIHNFATNRDFNYSSTLSTRIYGQFNFKIPFLKAIRHVVNPSVSFSYHPDFGNSRLGYWKEYTDTTGYVHRYSIFEQSLYGGPPDGRAGSIRLSVGNNLEAKIATGTDSTAEIKKITLLENLTFSIGYDLTKDSLNWSDLSITGRTTLFKGLILNYSSSFSPYVIDEQGRKHNQFLWDKERKLFHRNSSNYSAQLSLSINEKTLKRGGDTPKSEGQILTPPILQSPYAWNPALLVGTYADFSVPWNMSVNYTLTYVNSFVAATYNYESNITQTLSLSGNVTLTEKWKIAFSSGYDFINHGMSYTSIDIYRDLHCWEMRFNWVPFGYYKSWMFSINIKASSLRDIKYDKRRSYQDNQGYYRY